MYIGHGRLCVSVCAAPHSFSTARTRMQLWGMVRGAPSYAVHYRAHLQSVHGFRCYGNIHTLREMSVSALILAYHKPFSSSLLLYVLFV